MANAPTWEVRFSGTVEMNGARLSASLYLIDGKPSIWLLDPIPTITLSDLFHQFFNPLTWPAELINLTLTGATFYYGYSKPPADPFPPSLPADILALLNAAGQTAIGLFAAATATVTLADVKLPAVAVTAGIESGAGLTLAADLVSPVALIDAKFLMLSGPHFSNGPKLSIVNRTVNGVTTRQFTFDCSYTFFGKPFGSSLITVASDLALTAQLSVQGTVGPFTDPSLTLTWSKTDGFHITDFPQLPFRDAISNIEALLDKISSQNGCGSIGKLVGNALSGDCVVKPRITTTKPTVPANVMTGLAYVVTEGSFNVTAAGQPVASVPLPAMVVSLKAPTEFDFDGIVNGILSAITANAQQVVEQLWNDREQLATVLAVIAGEKALQQAAGSLSKTLCDDLKQYLEDFAEQFVEETIEKAIEYAFYELLGDGGVALALALAAATLLDAASKLDTIPGLTALAAPVVALTYQPDAEAIGVTFPAIARATGYQVLFFDSLQRLTGGLRQWPSGAGKGLVPVDVEQVPAGVCTIRVKALGNRTSDSNSPYSQAVIRKLTPPATVTVAASAAGGMTVIWTTTSARQYAASLRTAAEGTILVTFQMNAPAGALPPTFSHVFSAGDLAVAGSGHFRVGVQALNGATDVASASTDAPVTLQVGGGQLLLKGIGYSQIGSTFVVG